MKTTLFVLAYGASIVLAAAAFIGWVTAWQLIAPSRVWLQIAGAVGTPYLILLLAAIGRDLVERRSRP